MVTGLACELGSLRLCLDWRGHCKPILVPVLPGYHSPTWLWKLVSWTRSTRERSPAPLSLSQILCLEEVPSSSRKCRTGLPLLLATQAKLLSGERS